MDSLHFRIDPRYPGYMGNIKLQLQLKITKKVRSGFAENFLLERYSICTSCIGLVQYKLGITYQGEN
jgi:hypothetical protein